MLVDQKTGSMSVIEVGIYNRPGTVYGCLLWKDNDSGSEPLIFGLGIHKSPLPPFAKGGGSFDGLRTNGYLVSGRTVVFRSPRQLLHALHSVLASCFTLTHTSLQLSEQTVIWFDWEIIDFHLDYYSFPSYSLFANHE